MTACSTCSGHGSSGGISTKYAKDVTLKRRVVKCKLDYGYPYSRITALEFIDGPSYICMTVVTCRVPTTYRRQVLRVESTATVTATK